MSRLSDIIIKRSKDSRWFLSVIPAEEALDYDFEVPFRPYDERHFLLIVGLRLDAK